MDEAKLLTLIAQGESESVDFKQELHLKSAKEKSEFIKDLISLVNSSPNKSYLIVGVDDNKYIVGVDQIQEERVQQIAYTYIEPAINLQCHLVPVSTIEIATVGVIELRAKGRPHKVARAIENLNKDDVFIRRGTVVSKASPEEIIAMQDFSPRLQREIRQYLKAAESHSKLNNWEAAITAYSKVIEIAPTSENFLTLAQILEKQLENLEKPKNLDWQDWVKSPNGPEELAKNCLKAYTNVFNLSAEKEIEYEARLGRLRVSALYPLYAGIFYLVPEYEEDISWLKENVEGYRYGEVLFWQARGSELETVPNDIVSALNEAIELDYKKPEVYLLRAEGHIELFNYGLALQDIDTVFSLVSSEDRMLVEALCRKALVLCKMKLFDKAYQALLEAEEISKEEVRRHLYLDTYSINEQILFESAFERRFGKADLDPVRQMVFSLLAISKARRTHILGFQNSEHRIYINELDGLVADCPGILQTIRELVGQDIWQLMTHKEGFSLSFNFESIND